LLQLGVRDVECPAGILQNGVDTQAVSQHDRECRRDPRQDSSADGFGDCELGRVSRSEMQGQNDEYEGGRVTHNAVEAAKVKPSISGAAQVMP